MYNLSSKNKGTNQLLGYRAADLHLCFGIYKKQGFLMTRLICFSDLVSSKIRQKTTVKHINL